MARRVQIPEYLMVFQREYQEALAAYPLVLTDYRLLAECWMQCEYGGEVKLSTSELGRLVGIDRADASRGMQRLVDAGYILRERLRANRYKYLLPATLFWKGHLEGEWERRRPQDLARQLLQRLAAKRDDS